MMVFDRTGGSGADPSEPGCEDSHRPCSAAPVHRPSLDRSEMTPPHRLEAPHPWMSFVIGSFSIEETKDVIRHF
jgi:hypothetical protein